MSGKLGRLRESHLRRRDLEEIGSDGFRGPALVHQHRVGFVGIGVVFVRGLGDAGHTNGIPLAHQNLAHPRAVFP